MHVFIGKSLNINIGWEFEITYYGTSLSQLLKKAIYEKAYQKC
jgi:hypothetical protein